MTPGIRSVMAGVIFGSSRCAAILGSGNVTAAGDDLASAAPLEYTMNVVADADGAVGVILPTPKSAGQQVWVYNAAAAGLLVYPRTDAHINGGTGSAAITMAAKTLAIFTCRDGTHWAAAYTAA